MMGDRVKVSSLVYFTVLYCLLYFTGLLCYLLGSGSLEAVGFTVTVPSHGAQHSLGIYTGGPSVSNLLSSHLCSVDSSALESSTLLQQGLAPYLSLLTSLVHLEACVRV